MIRLDRMLKNPAGWLDTFEELRSKACEGRRSQSGSENWVEIALPTKKTTQQNAGFAGCV